MAWLFFDSIDVEREDTVGGLDIDEFWEAIVRSAGAWHHKQQQYSISKGCGDSGGGSSSSGSSSSSNTLPEPCKMPGLVHALLRSLKIDIGLAKSSTQAGPTNKVSEHTMNSNPRNCIQSSSTITDIMCTSHHVRSF